MRTLDLSNVGFVWILAFCTGISIGEMRKGIPMLVGGRNLGLDWVGEVISLFNK